MIGTNSLSQLLHDKRGAAMVEGVIVLPLFVIVLAAVIYFHRAYASKIDMGVKARSCAWSYAANGCQKKDLPKGCPVSEIGDRPKSVSGLFGADFKESFGLDESEKVVQELDAQHGALDSALQGANAIGLGVLQLSEGIKVTPSTSFGKPSILGGGTHSISGDYSVMCNERNRTIKDLAVGAYCSVSSSLPGC